VKAKDDDKFETDGMKLRCETLLVKCDLINDLIPLFQKKEAKEISPNSDRNSTSSTILQAIHQMQMTTLVIADS
jgi:hypothetical protein